MGLRQGDPISPFLFILCAEVLAKLITRSLAQGKFEGIWLNINSPPISHLLFVDNLTVFRKANEQSAQVIYENLGKYQEWSGQKINLN